MWQYYEATIVSFAQNMLKLDQRRPGRKAALFGIRSRARDGLPGVRIM